MYDFSFIIASRNDNHGGNMREKNIFFINRWLYQVKKHNLNCELIIVDWNSKKPLRKIIKPSILIKNKIIKIIEVSNQIHEKYKNSKKINFFQMIAKNVGARRAEGKFLIFSNIDIIFSENFFKYLKNNTIKNKTIYRADRHDVDLKKLQDYKIIEDNIQKLTTHIHKKNYTYDIKNNNKNYLRKTFFFILKFLIKSIFDFLKYFFINIIIFLYKIFLFEIRNLSIFINRNVNILKKEIQLLINIFNINNLIILFEKKLHTNACGDFTMIDKESFYEMKGYYEFDGFSWHIDSLLLFKAYYYFNLNFIELKFPMYHINHEPGKSYSENKKISINKIKKTKLDFINDQKLLNIINKYKKKKMYENDKNKAWGLDQKKLPVYKI
jgi:hypothetical protein